ncbi:hypothetical protein HDU76_013855, partial [Blyttiomyces sp. JEL0837]
LVVMVAQYSQKDPREYLPFLTELRQLSKYRQRFRIDDHLERWESAVGNLATLVMEAEQGGNWAEAETVFAEFLKYVSLHGLHRRALEIFDGSVGRRKAILHEYAEILASKAEFNEAGLMFYMADEKVKALEMYKRDVCWVEAFNVAFELGTPDEEIREMAAEMSAALLETHKFKDAAIVLEDYAKDTLGAVRALARGSMWAEALRLSRKNGKHQFVDEAVKPAVLEGADVTTDLIKEMTETFVKQTERLKSVKAEKERKQAMIDAGEYDPLLDTIDMMSDTSSMASSGNRSNMTGRTGITGLTGLTGLSSKTGKTWSSGKTAKNRRKTDRKRAAGREGTMYEEEFLVNSIYKAVIKSNDMRAEVKSLVTALHTHGYSARAKEVQEAFGAMIPVLRNGIVGVFEPYAKIADLSVEDAKRRLMVESGALPAESDATSVFDPDSKSKWAPKFPTEPPKFIDDPWGYTVFGSMKV